MAVAEIKWIQSLKNRRVIAVVAGIARSMASVAGEIIGMPRRISILTLPRFVLVVTLNHDGCGL
jgi:hypothetical protein